MVVGEYNGFEPRPGSQVNGKLTLGENWPTSAAEHPYLVRTK